MESDDRFNQKQGISHYYKIYIFETYLYIQSVLFEKNCIRHCYVIYNLMWL